MREILFRGKSLHDGEWLYGAYYKQEEYYGDPCDYHYIIYSKDELEDNMMLFESVIPETVGQYTGLTDENGKKIFEGDIVKCIFISPYQESEFVSEVVFLDGSWFVHESEDCDVYLYSYEIEGAGSLSEIKVIGNIHDNPELMKGGEKQ